MSDLLDSELDQPLDDADVYERQQDHEATHLWIVSYSDFMTILMIFFLMLFAHRLWAKKVSWEERRVQQLKAARETQQGMVQRLANLAAVDVAAERVNIHLPDALLFESGKAQLRPTASALLAQIAPELRSFTGDMVVEGHTDDQPLGARSAFKSNWELSVARAFSVIQELTAQGVDPARLSARGYGPYRPRVLNDTSEHRSENRRIEIILLNPKKNAA